MHSNHLNGLTNINSVLFGESFLKDELAELISSFDKAELRTYTKGSIVFTPEDSSCERLYILQQGRVNLYRLTKSGKKLVTRQILPGAVFGVRALLGRVMQKNFAEAVDYSKIRIITREQVLALLKHRPDLTLQIMEAICRRLCLLEEHFMEVAYNSVRVRLAYFLLNNADPATGVLNNITQEEIGDTIGAVRQTVAETLSLMRKRGLILIKPKQIKIINRRDIEEIIVGSAG